MANTEARIDVVVKGGSKVERLIKDVSRLESVVDRINVTPLDISVGRAESTFNEALRQLTQAGKKVKNAQKEYNEYDKTVKKLEKSWLAAEQASLRAAASEKKNAKEKADALIKRLQAEQEFNKAKKEQARLQEVLEKKERGFAQRLKYKEEAANLARVVSALSDLSSEYLRLGRFQTRTPVTGKVAATQTKGTVAQLNAQAEALSLVAANSEIATRQFRQFTIASEIASQNVLSARQEQLRALAMGLTAPAKGEALSVASKVGSKEQLAGARALIGEVIASYGGIVKSEAALSSYINQLRSLQSIVPFDTSEWSLLENSINEVNAELGQLQARYAGLRGQSSDIAEAMAAGIASPQGQAMLLPQFSVKSAAEKARYERDLANKQDAQVDKLIALQNKLEGEYLDQNEAIEIRNKFEKISSDTAEGLIDSARRQTVELKRQINVIKDRNKALQDETKAAVSLGQQKLKEEGKAGTVTEKVDNVRKKLESAAKRIQISAQRDLINEVQKKNLLLQLDEARLEIDQRRLTVAQTIVAESDRLRRLEEVGNRASAVRSRAGIADPVEGPLELRQKYATDVNKEYQKQLDLLSKIDDSGLESVRKEDLKIQAAQALEALMENRLEIAQEITKEIDRQFKIEQKRAKPLETAANKIIRGGETLPIDTPRRVTNTLASGAIIEQGLLNLQAKGVNVTDQLVSLQKTLNDAKRDDFQISQNTLSNLEQQIRLAGKRVTLEKARLAGKGGGGGTGDSGVTGFSAALSPAEARKQIDQIYKDFNKAVAGNVEGAGENVASTFADELRRGSSSGAAAAETFATAALQAIKKVFRISSPSRVMKEIAENLVSSFITELVSNIPSVKTALERTFNPKGADYELRGPAFTRAPSPRMEIDPRFMAALTGTASQTGSAFQPRAMAGSGPPTGTRADALQASSEIYQIGSTAPRPPRRIRRSEANAAVSNAINQYRAAVDNFWELEGSQFEAIRRILTSSARLSATRFARSLGQRPELSPGERIVEEARTVAASQRRGILARTRDLITGEEELGISSAVRDTFRRVSESLLDSLRSLGSSVSDGFRDAVDRVRNAVPSTLGGIARGGFGGFGGRGGGGGGGGAAGGAAPIGPRRTEDLQEALRNRRLGPIARATNEQLEELARRLQDIRNRADATGDEFRQLGRDLAVLGRQQERRDPGAEFLTRRFGPRGGRAVSEGLIGGAFPLLFGQGIGSSVLGGLGGAAGGFAGGGLGFGLSLVGTAIGSSIDTLIQKSGELASALDKPAESFDKLKEISFFSTKALEKQIEKSQAYGNEVAVTTAIQEEALAKLGVGGVANLASLEKQSDRANRAFAELSQQMQAVVAGPVAGVKGFFADVAERAAAGGRVKALRADLTKEERKEFEAELLERLQKAGIKRGPGGGEVSQAEIGILASRNQLQDIIDKWNDIIVKGKIKVTNEQELRTQINSLGKFIEAQQSQLSIINIPKGVFDQIKTASRQQEDLDRQRYDLIESYEKSISEIRLNVEKQITQERLANIQKENEALKVQGDIRLQELKNANLDLRQSLFGNDFGQQLFDIVSKFTEEQLATENEIANRRKNLEAELQAKAVQVEDFKSSVAKQVADLNISTEKQISQLKLSTLRQSQDYDQRRFELEKQINTTRLRYELLIAKQKRAEVIEQLKAEKDPERIKILSQQAQIYTDLGRQIPQFINQIQNATAPKKLAFSAPQLGGSVSTAGFDAVAEKGRNLLLQIEGLQQQLDSLAKQGRIKDINFQLNQLADQGVSGLIDEYEQLKLTLSGGNAFDIARNKIISAFDAILSSKGVIESVLSEPLSALIRLYRKLALENQKLVETLEFVTTAQADHSGKIQATKDEINLLLAGTSEYEKTLFNLTVRGIQPATEEFQELIASAREVDRLAQKAEVLNALTVAATEFSGSIRGLIDDLIELGDASQAVVNFTESLSKKTLGFVLDIAFKPIEDAMQETFIQFAEKLGFDVKPEGQKQLESVQEISKNVNTIKEDIANFIKKIPRVQTSGNLSKNEKQLIRDAIKQQMQLSGNASKAASLLGEAITVEVNVDETELDGIRTPEDAKPFLGSDWGVPPGTYIPGPQGPIKPPNVGGQGGQAERAVEALQASQSAQRLQVIPYSEVEEAVEGMNKVGEGTKQLAVDAASAVAQIDTTSSLAAETVKTSTERVNSVIPAWGASLGKVVTGIAGAVAGITAISGGITQMKDGGTYGVLSGLAGIFGGIASVAGAFGSIAGLGSIGSSAGKFTGGYFDPMTGLGAAGPNFGFAKGGMFSNSIVSSPTLFKFANGGITRNGLMGEAGPEAVMPLSRGADGRLGVDASGISDAIAEARDVLDDGSAIDVSTADEQTTPVSTDSYALTQAAQDKERAGTTARDLAYVLQDSRGAVEDIKRITREREAIAASMPQSASQDVQRLLSSPDVATVIRETLGGSAGTAAGQVENSDGSMGGVAQTEAESFRALADARSALVDAAEASVAGDASDGTSDASQNVLSNADRRAASGSNKASEELKYILQDSRGAINNIMRVVKERESLASTSSTSANNESLLSKETATIREASVGANATDQASTVPNDLSSQQIEVNAVSAARDALSERVIGGDGADSGTRDGSIINSREVIERIVESRNPFDSNRSAIASSNTAAPFDSNRSAIASSDTAAPQNEVAEISTSPTTERINTKESIITNSREVIEKIAEGRNPFDSNRSAIASGNSAVLQNEAAGIGTSSTTERINTKESSALTQAKEMTNSVMALNQTRQMLNSVSSVNKERSVEKVIEATASGSVKPLDVRYESQVINNVEYVTAEQHRKGIAEAAERGKNMAFQVMQNSVTTRKRLGL